MRGGQGVCRVDLEGKTRERLRGFPMAERDEKRDLEELGARFGSRIRLSDKEREGIKINRKAVE